MNGDVLDTIRLQQEVGTRGRAGFKHYATVEDVNAVLEDVTGFAAAEDVNAVFARRKEQADAIHKGLERRIYYLERMMRRLTHPITIPEGWFEIEDRPLTDCPSTPPEPKP